MKSTLYLMCLCFIGCTQVYGRSTYIQDVLIYINGEWDNKGQTDKRGDQHDFLQSRYIPVNVSMFPKDPVLLIEEANNGVVRLLQLVVVTENKDGSFSGKIYNFTDTTKYKPREYDVKNLSNLTRADLQSDEDCVTSFSIVEDFLTSIYPDCTNTFNGTHPRFTGTFECNVLTISVPINIRQKATIEPYILRRTSPEYPLMNPPKDYVSPCDKQVKTT